MGTTGRARKIRLPLLIAPLLWTAGMSSLIYGMITTGIAGRAGATGAVDVGQNFVIGGAVFAALSGISLILWVVLTDHEKHKLGES